MDLTTTSTKSRLGTAKMPKIRTGLLRSYIFKIAIFRKLRFSQHFLFLNFTVFFSKICDFLVKRVLNLFSFLEHATYLNSISNIFLETTPIGKFVRAARVKGFKIHFFVCFSSSVTTLPSYPLIF
jgi:hypothetical protein